MQWISKERRSSDCRGTRSRKKRKAFLYLTYRSLGGGTGPWFVGIYAAFWLNNYQQHRQDAERRDRILASLEEELRTGIESGKLETAKEEREATEFRRGLDVGEMPPLRPFVFTTDYSPGDFATWLQACGI